MILWLWRSKHLQASWHLMIHPSRIWYFDTLRTFSCPRFDPYTLYTLMTSRGIFWGLGAWGTWDWTGRSALQRLPFGASSCGWCQSGSCGSSRKLEMDTRCFPRWWFQRFFIFSPTWGRFPIWLILFRFVDWNHQPVSLWHARLNLYLLNVRTSWSSHGSVNDRDVRWYCPKYFWLQNFLLLGVNSKLPVSQPNAPRVLPFEEGSDKCLRSLGQCLKRIVFPCS